MLRILVFRFVPTIALACGLTASVCAAEPAADAKQAAAPAAERIRKVFDQKITIDIAEQPLFLALNQLREHTKINFILDRQTLQNMGQDPEALPVNVKKKDAKVGDVLKAIIQPYNLGFAIIGDTVFISTDDMAMVRQLKQHITVDVEKVEVAAALNQLARETSTNIKLDPKAAKEGKTLVTLQMDDVPLETAVRLLAETANLKVVRTGNVLYVTVRANANELRKASAAEGISVDYSGPVRIGRHINWPPGLAGDW